MGLGISHSSSVITALLFTAILTTAIIGILPPFWDGNDDLGMSMIAEGYGLAAYPSPAVLFSNVLYGHLISGMPQMGDVSRYSLLSIGLNIAAIFIICRALILLSDNIFSALAVTTLVALLPLAFPRFTLLAGMLTIAGLSQLLVYLQDKRVWDLVIAVALLFIGYLVRSGPFFLILIVAFVLLPWKDLLVQRAPKHALLGLGATIAAAMLADWWYYQSPQWSAFRELGLARMAALTDYRIAGYLLSHPELLRGTSYSLNDISLLGNWWFVDPGIADPKRLSALLELVSPSDYLGANWEQRWDGLAALIQAPLVFLFLPAAVASALAQNRVRLFLAWLILVTVIVVYSLLGRASALGYVIYTPLVFLLCVAAVQIKRLALQTGLAVLVGLCAVAEARGLARRHSLQLQEHAQAAADLATIDKSKLYVVWGSAIPLQSVYPVFGSMAAAREFRWYGIGAGALAPFAIGQWKDTSGGLPARLVSGDPVPFFATRRLMEHLAIYCDERLAANMRTVDVQQLRIGTIFTVTCR